MTTTDSIKEWLSQSPSFMDLHPSCISRQRKQTSDFEWLHLEEYVRSFFLPECVFVNGMKLWGRIWITHSKVPVGFIEYHSKVLGVGLILVPTHIWMKLGAQRSDVLSRPPAIPAGSAAGCGDEAVDEQPLVCDCGAGDASEDTQTQAMSNEWHRMQNSNFKKAHDAVWLAAINCVEKDEKSRITAFVGRDDRNVSNITRLPKEDMCTPQTSSAGLSISEMAEIDAELLCLHDPATFDDALRPLQSADEHVRLDLYDINVAPLHHNKKKIPRRPLIGQTSDMVLQARVADIQQRLAQVIDKRLEDERKSNMCGLIGQWRALEELHRRHQMALHASLSVSTAPPDYDRPFAGTLAPAQSQVCDSAVVIASLPYLTQNRLKASRCDFDEAARQNKMERTLPGHARGGAQTKVALAGYVQRNHHRPKTIEKVPLHLSVDAVTTSLPLSGDARHGRWRRPRKELQSTQQRTHPSDTPPATPRSHTPKSKPVARQPPTLFL
jgi:hypothetical protein